MFSQEVIKSLRDEMPRGFAIQIKKRLEQRNIKYSRGMIEQVMNPNNPRTNSEIVIEALALLNEIKAKNQEILQQLRKY